MWFRTRQFSWIFTYDNEKEADSKNNKSSSEEGKAQGKREDWEIELL